MRTICFALVLLVLPVVASAQNSQAERQHGRPAENTRAAEQPRSQPGTLGPIGLPLPSIGLPLPSIGIQAVPGLQLQGQGTQRDDPAFSPGHVHRSWPQVVYVVQPYAYANPYTAGPSAAAPVSAPTVVTPEPLSGTLRLDISPPGRWQLFVDGVFFGTADDLGNEIALPPGPRRIELRAPGYQTLVFDARIEVDRTITYRGALNPVAPPARGSPPSAADAPAPAPWPNVATGSRILYVIPGCYLGNVLPQKEKLRAGCDISSMKTITP